jgi:hypothetical protein
LFEKEEKMSLSEEQVKQLNYWMSQHRMNPTCPACGGRKWIPGEIIASPLYSHEKGFSIGGPTIPMVQLVCGDCNYLMLFAAKRIFGMK